MSEHVPFIRRVLDGKILEPDAQIEAEIEEWHNSNTELELHDWLGLTEAEYDLFLAEPSTLRLIIQAHQGDANEQKPR